MKVNSRPLSTVKHTLKRRRQVRSVWFVGKVGNVKTIKKSEGEGATSGVICVVVDDADDANGARYTGDCSEAVTKYEVGKVTGNGEKMPSCAGVDDP